jgi:hypothetical protein
MTEMMAAMTTVATIQTQTIPARLIRTMDRVAV